MSVRRSAALWCAAALALGGLSACADESLSAAPGAQDGAQTEAVAIATNVPARNVPVDSVLEVSAEGGSLESVSVSSDAGRLSGAFDASGAWVADGRLEPGTTYLIRTVSTAPSGGSQRDRLRFSTVDLGLEQQAFASVAPLDGETVGVGMPVVVTFDVPVTDHASMERHMTVSSSPAQKGAWHWLSDHEAHWRPASYWQPGTDVTVDLAVNSVAAGGGVFGQSDRHVDFHIGDAHIYRVNAETHQMQVFSSGDLLRTIPITTGKEGFVTRSGVKVIIEKFRERRMNSETVGIAADDPEAYDIEDVEYAMRLTWSGEFVHAAPWSVSSQGHANVSHGCTGMSTADAGWLYAMSIRGDVVEYVGTDRPMTLTNGYGDWNASFADWKAGSAL